jgi:putative AdoMet-dependent methyltransferase
VIKVGREFLDVFDEWSSTYDDTVVGTDPEYREVFKDYHKILEKVTDLSVGHVLEFGTGTGNLTKMLLDAGHSVTAIEPSSRMRAKAVEKLGDLVDIRDGDFLNFPLPNVIHSIVSTYAFHHLTDKEKIKAIALYGNILDAGGKLIFADTMYQSKAHQKQAIKDAIDAKFLNLAKDLQTEYYTTIPFLRSVLKENNFEVSFERCNDFVWIMEAVKQ